MPRLLLLQPVPESEHLALDERRMRRRHVCCHHFHDLIDTRSQQDVERLSKR